jgi:hypothetical protein
MATICLVHDDLKRFFHIRKLNNKLLFFSMLSWRKEFSLRWVSSFSFPVLLPFEIKRCNLEEGGSQKRRFSNAQNVCPLPSADIHIRTLKGLQASLKCAGPDIKVV